MVRIKMKHKINFNIQYNLPTPGYGCIPGYAAC